MIYLASTQAFTSRPGHSRQLSGFSGGREGAMGGARCPGGLRGRGAEDTPRTRKNDKVQVIYKYVYIIKIITITIRIIINM
jgi:hypothetical protein